MSYATHKSTMTGKRVTLARKAARATKHGTRSPLDVQTILSSLRTGMALR